MSCMALVTSISVIDINDMALFCYGTRCHLVFQIRCYWELKIILTHSSSVEVIHIQVLCTFIFLFCQEVPLFFVLSGALCVTMSQYWSNTHFLAALAALYLPLSLIT